MTNSGNLREGNLSEFMQTARSLIDAELERILTQMTPWPGAKVTPEIMRHAIFSGGGGKRIRSLFAALTAVCLNAPMTAVLEAAAAIEMIHAYSLIIDDIQDCDEVRRGEPTAHAKYGTELSLLAAGRLLIEGLSRLQGGLALPPEQLRNILHKLHAGQEADFESERWPSNSRNLTSVEFIFEGKTGALFELASLVGLYSSGSGTRMADDFSEFGNEIGLIFQAVDDFLEVTGSEQRVGKPLRKDRAGKLTFMTLHSDIDAARAAIHERRLLLEEKIHSMFSEESAPLMLQFLGLVVDRDS